MSALVVQMVRVAFSASKEVDTKDGYADLVTDADRDVEEMIIQSLANQYPDHRYLFSIS